MSAHRPHEQQADPWRAGTAGRCPRCGRGPLFSGYITLRESCTACDLDYSFADAGDGPAAFVILIVGFIVVGLALWLEVSYGPALWVHLVIWVPLTVLLSLGALRIIKGLLVTLQYANRAAQGRLDR